MSKTIYGGDGSPKRMRRNVVRSKPKEYTNELFEALEKEYKALQKRIDVRESMLSKMEREFEMLGFDDDAKAHLEEALDKIRESNEKKDADDIEKFEEILNDPSVLRGAILGKNLGICDDLDGDDLSDDYFSDDIDALPF